MKNKIKITAVNYLNALPFKYALERSRDIQEWAEISYATPFECAEMLLKKQTHIALAPIAVLAYSPELKIVTDFCLSTYNKVDSVKLYSKRDISQIQTITLDYQSLSSVTLIKILMRHYWKKNVQYVQGVKGFENNFNTDAIVVIGDRTFELNGKFEYEYDLAYEWYLFYGKSFVFAAWITNINLNNTQINALNNVFEYGINHLDIIIEDVLKNYPDSYLNSINQNEKREIISDYLKNKIQYRLTDDRKESIEYFLTLMETIETIKV